MKRSSVVPSVIRAALTKHFELFLTTAGVLLAILVTASELSRQHQDISLIFLIWLQGLILWAVHRHSWFLRRTLFCEVQSVLQDRLKHHFTVMLSASALLDGDVGETARERLKLEYNAARMTYDELEKVSVESVRMWSIRDPFLAFLRL